MGFICVYMCLCYNIVIQFFRALYACMCARARVRACVGGLGLVFSYARARVGIFFGFSFFCGQFLGNIFSSAVRQKAFLVLFEHKKYVCFLCGKIGAIKALIQIHKKGKKLKYLVLRFLQRFVVQYYRLFVQYYRLFVQLFVSKIEQG